MLIDKDIHGYVHFGGFCEHCDSYSLSTP
uniref:Uncharacterized protein n=1 Tax=Rhizophora mucronata TaxID=61149 RepID=A0A2P2PFH6_RHIMU